MSPSTAAPFKLFRIASFRLKNYIIPLLEYAFNIKNKYIQDVFLKRIFPRISLNMT